MYKKTGVNKLSKKNTIKRTTIRNKAFTKNLYVISATEIIGKEGIDNYGLSKVAKGAGRSKRMIYEYFGNMDGLLKTVIQKAAFMLGYGQGLDTILDNNRKDNGKELLKEAVRRYFEHFKNNLVLQEVTLKELNNPTDLIKDFAADRDEYGEKLFSLTTAFFEGSGVESNFINTYFYASINYLVLREKSTNMPFLGVDIKNKDVQEGLNQHAELLIDLLYAHITEIKAK